MGEKWSAVGDDLARAMADAAPRIRQMASPTGLLGLTEDHARNVRSAEVRLCIGILQRDPDIFDESRRSLELRVPDRDWAVAVRERALAVASIVDDGGMEAADDLFEQRRQQIDRLLS